MSKKQNIDVVLLKKKLQDAEFTIKEALKLLSGEQIDFDSNQEDLKIKAKKQEIIEEEKIIEGVFDGQNMIGPDEKMYPVPANYASKSKLIEGDVLKLTISEDGTFVFKQIGPIDRNKMIGQVKQVSQDEYIIESEDKTFKILLASATYFKLEDGDTVTIVVPQEKESAWAAIENVIKKAI
ncbi:MAG: hypothetical protein HQ538_03655 [Parcubacteria group bacterium]|nr:hypothetical protein [Parcubacteria group bacterium]